MSAARPLRKDPLRPDQAPAQSKGQRRTDPKRLRPTNRLTFIGKVLNAAEDRKYVWASKSDPMTGMGFYEAIGYKVEIQGAEENAVRAGGAMEPRIGQPIEFMGNVLMSISVEDWEQLEAFGYDGGGGQAHADDVEERIIRDRNKKDLLRGLGAEGYMGVRANIGAPQAEMVED